jgi:hypothetical protein
MPGEDLGPVQTSAEKKLYSTSLTQAAGNGRFQAHGWVGLLLVAICWPMNWALPGMRTAYLFFPLWLGYILVVDTIVWIRSSTSLWNRSKGHFVLLFVVSAPAWWLFEVINARTANWEYLGSAIFTPVQYYLLCTISFSTVMPAVFETAELVRTFRWVERRGSGPVISDLPVILYGLLLTGIAMMTLTILWPKFCYPFVWTSLVLILEPLNHWLGHPSFLAHLRRGDWRPVISLSLGALVCGFFWEMWNYYSYPKWIYHTPGAQFLHVFEMPLLGYFGYIPFALELYGLKNIVWPHFVPLRI